MEKPWQRSSPRTLGSAMTVSVCERADDFRIAVFFPDVKVVVIALPRDTG